MSSAFEYPVSSALKLALDCGLVPPMSSTMPVPLTHRNQTDALNSQQKLENTNSNTAARAVTQSALKELP